MKSVGLRSRSRGFSLVELMAVVVVIAITLSIAVPKFFQMERQNRFARVSRSLVSDLRRSRVEAQKGGCLVDPGSSTCPTESRIRNAGIRFKNFSDGELCDGYEVFVDADGTPNNGNESTIATVDVLSVQGTTVRFNVPEETEIRFASNGVAGSHTLDPLEVSVHDEVLQRSSTIVISGAGFVSISD